MTEIPGWLSTEIRSRQTDSAAAEASAVEDYSVAGNSPARLTCLADALDGGRATRCKEIAYTCAERMLLDCL